MFFFIIQCRKTLRSISFSGRKRSRSPAYTAMNCDQILPAVSNSLDSPRLVKVHVVYILLNSYFCLMNQFWFLAYFIQKYFDIMFRFSGKTLLWGHLKDHMMLKKQHSLCDRRGQLLLYPILLSVLGQIHLRSGGKDQ